MLALSLNSTKELNLNWAVDIYVGARIDSLFPRIKKVEHALKTEGYSEEQKLDNDHTTGFYLPHALRGVFCIESQNANYIFIRQPSSYTSKPFPDALHVRRYWNKFSVEDSYEDLEKYRADGTKGIEWAIRQADTLAELYSDNLGDEQFVVRPDLQWFKDKDFSLEYDPEKHMTKYDSYGDMRDYGYVLSYGCDDLPKGRVESSISNFDSISDALFNFLQLERELKERNQL